MGKRAAKVLYINGINAATGGWLHAPRDINAVAGRLAAPPAQEPRAPIARRTMPQMPARPPRMSLIGADDSHVDPRTGWGIVFSTDEKPEVRQALAPLIEHRKQQVGAGFKELEPYPYPAGCSWMNWLGAHDAIPGVLDTTKIPYYVLIVGGPDRIPYGFQYLMGVEYAVGRIAFDTAEDYAAYAESVVRYETDAAVSQGRWAGFFGTAHAGDGATEGSAEHLVTPLAGQPWDFRVKRFVAETALKKNLLGMLHAEGEAQGPALLFTATHGAAFPAYHDLVRDRNGALVCQDWPGIPPGAGPNTILAGLKKEYYLSAQDITDDTRIHGMIGFHFACFGAGTPRYDNFALAPGETPHLLSDAPFVARLPQRMLAHPKGGALAVIGHVDRVWSYSFQTDSAGDQIGPFRETISRLFRGQSVGRAMKEFKERYAALCVYLVCAQEKAEGGLHMEPDEYATLLTECNDAQNYVIVGDPAVKLRVDQLR
jgi:hypothetical protein